MYQSNYILGFLICIKMGQSRSRARTLSLQPSIPFVERGACTFQFPLVGVSLLCKTVYPNKVSLFTTPQMRTPLALDWWHRSFVNRLMEKRYHWPTLQLDPRALQAEQCEEDLIVFPYRLSAEGGNILYMSYTFFSNHFSFRSCGILNFPDYL